jgi:hypothetical protein
METSLMEQDGQAPSLGQEWRAFDVIFGVVAPLVGLFLDLTLFVGAVTRYRPSVIALLLFGVATIAIWLWKPTATRPENGIIVGLLSLGVGVGVVFGVVLFQYSVIVAMLPPLWCLLLVTLAPWGTSLVFLHHAWRASLAGGIRFRSWRFVHALLTGAVILGVVSGSVEVTARLVRPEIAEPPIYPGSSDVVITHESREGFGSGLKMTYQSAASAEEIEAFYADTLLAQGWTTRTFSNFYDYRAGSGRYYELSLFLQSEGDRTFVRVSLRDY